MADNFNLINFKRGSLSDLQDLNTAAKRDQIEIGTFYLTIEEGAAAPESTRLFIGRLVNGVKKIVPVNQGIVTVANEAALRNGSLTGNFQVGDFVYILDGNILAVRSANGWVQINSVSDTYVNDINTTVSAVSNNTATIDIVADRTNAAGEVDEIGVKIQGAGGVTLSKTARATDDVPDTLVITGDQYAINRGTASQNASVITLSSDQNHNSSVTIKGSNTLNVTTPTEGVIELAAVDTKTVDLVASAAAQGFDLTLQQNNGEQDIVENIDPQIAIGSSTVHFVNGVATLDTYTKAELNDAFKTLNAMVYRGTVGSNGSAGATISGITSARIGDTFKVVSQITLPVANQYGASAGALDITLDVGDLIIVTGGTESAQTDIDPHTGGTVTGTIQYTVVPAGDEIDTTYSITSTSGSHNIVIHDNVEQSDIGSFSLAQGSQISLTDSGTSTDRVVTVAHASITTSSTPTTGTAQSMSGAGIDASQYAALTIPLITDIAVNNGHVTGWEISNYSVQDTNADLDSVTYAIAASNNIATITNTVGLLKNFAGAPTNAQTQNGIFKIESENLQVTAPTPTTQGVPEVKLNFVWGSF